MLGIDEKGGKRKSIKKRVRQDIAKVISLVYPPELLLANNNINDYHSNRELTYTNRIYLFLLLYSLSSLNQTDKFSPVSFIIMIQSLFSQTDYFVISSLTLEIRIPE